VEGRAAERPKGEAFRAVELAGRGPLAELVAQEEATYQSPKAVPARRPLGPGRIEQACWR
jgi:hypothetical protein